MDASVRVLVVEHRHADHRMADQLPADIDLNCQWHSVASTRELRTIATTFDPGVVLCTDDRWPASGREMLGAMRLLCSRPPAILVSSVRKSASPFEVEAKHFPATARPAPLLMDPPSFHAAPPRTQESTANMRSCFSSFLESRPDAAVICDSDGWITQANPCACHQLEDSFEQSLGTLLSKPGQWLRSRHWLDGERALAQEGAQSRGSNGANTPDVDRESGKCRLAYFDDTSGIHTPIHVNDLLRSVRIRARAWQSSFAFIVARHGQCPPRSEAAVSSLRILGSRPNGAALLSTPGRYGSVMDLSPDDFLIVLPEPCRPADAAITAQGVVDSLKQSPVVASWRADELARFETSPGFQGEAESPQKKGKNPLPLEHELRDALQRHALSVQYQPQYDLKTGRGSGIEALARWVLSTGEIVPPSVFIPVAERAGMIHDLGAWILQSACEATAAWCGVPRSIATLSVNVSALQIDGDFCALIERTLRRHRFPASQLELEITESALIANIDLAIEYLQDWKRLGVRIAVDDFGTGYSSLNYLSRLPLDRIKLDQSLVHMMTQNSRSAAVMRSILSLGAELGIDIIAEGVETDKQFQMLADFGCPGVQGYLLARPMSLNQAQVVLRKTWGNRPRRSLCPVRTAIGETHAY
jgi:EAL domain-containing protein (putative c-di-GMP-specific phosphodiesterase class I)/PAS domain-containing protein